MSEPLFTILAEKVYIDTRLSRPEIKKALTEVRTLATIPLPISHWSIDQIDVTNKEWHRQKFPDERFRTILKLDLRTKVIYIKAILVRDNDTYSIVRELYLRDDA